MIFIGLYLTVGLICFITNNGKRKLESEKERMQKQIILFMKRDYEDEI